MNKVRLADAVAVSLRDERVMSPLPYDLLWMPGHTSPKQRTLLNLVCEELNTECTYLEIGVFHGASLISAAYDNNGHFWGVDDWSYGTKENYRDAYHQFSPACVEARIIEGDIRKLPLDKLPQNVNVFYFDANWTDEASVNTLWQLQSRLADTFILIVDNWSRPYVRRLTYEALKDLEYSVYASWQLTSEADCDINGWWSGWGVFVVEKKPMRDTMKLRGFKEGEVKIWDIAKRKELGLNTIEDYKVE